MNKPNRYVEWLLSVPTYVWLIVFFVFPTFIILWIGFKPATLNGGIDEGWTLQNYREIFSSNYTPILLRTLSISIWTTVICILIAIPVGYWLARLPARIRYWMLLLVILPFWTNMLIRIFAWKTILHPEGFIKNSLVFLGIVEPNATLLYNEGSILIVLVYTYLPFAILPIYAAAEKFDFGLLDAAADLGARSWEAFLRVFIPGIKLGLITAVLIVFIPALGSYAIPDIMGGSTSEMLGNKIAQRTFTDRNLPQASALASLFAVVVMTPVLVYQIRRSLQ